MQNFYTVRHGDTLWQIASRWNIPISSLIAANNLSLLYIIFVGQQLSMPPGVDVYRVQAGDNVFSIAKRFGIHPDVIFAANELNPPYILQVNQLLKIPPGVKEYIVQPGDTLFQLARRFNVVTSGIVNYQFIRQYNRLQVDTLYIGQHIRIPYAPIGEKGYIAFFSNEDGTVELWIYHLGDGKKERLTDGLGESHSVPFWSPDGMHIAFVGRNLNLYVIHLQGKK